ncbi:OmpA family protein [Phaeovibrio sulfidiphilus]|uniref:OmpA family protein n=1 Tax=Phaeovibrio sulfidiphilus TaxID=1220600 RepID=A0A8J6YR55_9PROT|nr:OmpA family protein [Phaeovibrio sulfidiphilus]MBE1237882.1 OmpA family protein [Phaeovibrio sulfidiphilus]
MKTILRPVLGVAFLVCAATGVSAQTAADPSGSAAAQAPAPSVRTLGGVPGGPVVQGPYNVFFDFNSSDLTPGGLLIVDAAADKARNASKENGSVQVHVAGHTDTWHDEDRCATLSEARAEAVRDELVKKGVPPEAITLEAKGKTDLLVDTADRVREPQNRRATIVVK